MILRKRNAKLVVVALGLVGGVMSVGTAAAHDIDGCGVESTCIWDLEDFQDRLVNRDEGLGWNNLAVSARNRNESWANNSENRNACAAGGLGGSEGSGGLLDWPVDGHDDATAPWNDNEVESLKTNGPC